MSGDVERIGRLAAPSAEDLAALGERLLAQLPKEIRELVGMVPIRVEEWPDEDALDATECDDPLDLTGLYRAVPIAERHARALPPEEPEMIFLYRLPILVEWAERGCTLEEVVFDVLTHEIAHHLGMDEIGALRVEGRDEPSRG
ncbi:MAG: neutral zinc metallopeptidase [Geminicoccaceae bacterium]|jgi:acetylglutamate kinase|nr:MAG: neutral zinc metallopeptidase [Geminicoccaceae bacterium]